MFEMHAFVSGRVQGVGFRYRTKILAEKLGLKGTVCNLDDGRVEIYAQGTEERLEQFLVALERTFELHRESSFSLEFSPPKQHFDVFLIVL